jgi:hypothetical protein
MSSIIFVIHVHIEAEQVDPLDAKVNRYIDGRCPTVLIPGYLAGVATDSFKVLPVSGKVLNPVHPVGFGVPEFRITRDFQSRPTL